MEDRIKNFLNMDWLSRLGDFEDGMGMQFEDKKWEKTEIPHNWDNYHGYHKVSHGNLHGTAWYRKHFMVDNEKRGQHCFIEFEGVGSYAKVWLNGHYLGEHKGGRTCFSMELTDYLKYEEDNVLAVRAYHPAKIDDLPWVCGGCFGTPNSEGSQPFGIFRPVDMIFTGDIRIEPFGVFITTPKASETEAFVRNRSEIKNYGDRDKKITITSEIYSPINELVDTLVWSGTAVSKEGLTIDQTSCMLVNPMLWSLETPNLYNVKTTIMEENQIINDQVQNDFGIRYIEWENFNNDTNEIIDEKKLIEEPSNENNYFVTYTRSGEHAKVGIIPGGVHVTIPKCSSERTIIELTTTIINRDVIPHSVLLESFIQTYNGTKSIANLKTEVFLKPGMKEEIKQRTNPLSFIDRWTKEDPYLHTVVSTVRDTEEVLKEYNQTQTSFGIFETGEMANKGNPYVKGLNTTQLKENSRFLLNGKPVFINGTCEYEHLLGNDHAFYEEQIHARIMQIKAAGFNSFREAHCPHNLRYLEECDKLGILYWAQMGAHLYFDNEGFHENFKQLTKEWVRERRNSPSVILWGIQNESMLPAAFANEIRDIIRELDDTSPMERKTNTCNGGSGSDWNIPQNWSGTYGRSVEDYDKEVVEQKLIGEYGQYRVIGKHEEGNCEEKQNAGGDVSEELFAYCLETKVRLGEQVKDQIYGHYQWIFNTHANPGREVLYCFDGSSLDGVGVVNSKGLLTCWGEPVDAFYMYRSHYAPKETEAMVYIVSHTWPDRFEKPGQKATITIYSNCDEVELFNDYEEISLGRRQRGPKGVHFTFEDVEINYNLLYAKGYINNISVAEDVVLLLNLEPAPHLNKVYKNPENITESENDQYLFRVNCGGNEYTDVNGQKWSGDQKYEARSWGWKSWGMEYDDVEDALGSVRRVYDPIQGTLDQELIQTFRYGREKLSYSFPIKSGKYKIELYFMEPWYGVGGKMNCAGWRVFDVAVNHEIVLQDFDIWKEAGVHTTLKKVIPVEVSDNEITITFPRIKSYQAVISAIAICKTE